MSQEIARRLELLANEGRALVPQGGNTWDGYNEKLQTQYVSWRMRSLTAISYLGDRASVLTKEIASDSNSSFFFKQSTERILGCLDAALDIAISPLTTLEATIPQDQGDTGQSRNVFLVHGHDEGAKEATARLVEKLGLSAVVLHEQPNAGQTIIEKFERHSVSGAAVVLLTPDDIGALAGHPNDLQPRARQNVILELGFFIGALGRRRVIALLKGNVEVPSDFSGILYIPMDNRGAWRIALAKELKEVGMAVDLTHAL